MQAVLQDIVKAAAAGFPKAESVPDVAQLVLSGPSVHASGVAPVPAGPQTARWKPSDRRTGGSQVLMPGLTFDLPAGWEIVRNPKVAAEIKSPENMTFIVTWDRTWQDTDDYIEAATNDVRRSNAIKTDTAGKLSGAPARLLTYVTANGTGIQQRITTLGGLGVVVTCGTPAAMTSRAGSVCDELFRSVHLDPLALAQ